MPSKPARFQGQPARGFDHQTGPIRAHTVLPARAGVGEKRRVEHLQVFALHVGGQFRAGEGVGIAGGVREQLAQRHRTGRGAQNAAIQHHSFADFGEHFRRGHIKRQRSTCDELHRAERGERLGHGGDADDGSDLHGLARAGIAKRPRVTDAITVHGDGGDEGDLAAFYGSTKDGIDTVSVHCATIPGFWRRSGGPTFSSPSPSPRLREKPSRHGVIRARMRAAIGP